MIKAFGTEMEREKFRIRNTKGQVFSLDMVVSVVIFIIALIFLISLWNLYSTRLQDNISSEELYLLSFQVSDILSKTSGVPNNWEKGSNVSVIGLKLGPGGGISDDKLNAFLTYDYKEAKKVFNIERFDYQFKLLDKNGNLLNSSGLAPSDSKQAVSISHFITVKNETRRIQFTLWK